MHDEDMMKRYFSDGWSIAKIQTEFGFSTAYINRLIKTEKDKGRIRHHDLRAAIPLDHRVMLVGFNLVTQREIKCLTVHEAAIELKVSVRTLKKYEDGTQDIPLSFIIRASDFFNIPMKELLNA